MTMKPFEIQSTSLSINGVLIDTSATGNLVIPGLTRASSLYADEVDDIGDQTRTWQGGAFLLDAYHYGVTLGSITPDPSYSPADYSVDSIDGDGYIDGINVDTAGTWTQTVADYNRNNNMYAFISTNVQEQPFNPSHWVQIPFRVRAKANEVEYEFNTGGGSGNGITVGLFDAEDSLTDEVANITTIGFDSTTGFNITEMGDGVMKVSLGSSWKTWLVDGQDDLVAVGEDTVTFVAGSNMTIETNANDKTITFSSSGGGGGNPFNQDLNTTDTVTFNQVNIGNNASISVDGELRLWATDTDISVYRNGRDGYGVFDGEIRTYANNSQITSMTVDGLEIVQGHLKFPDNTIQTTAYTGGSSGESDRLVNGLNEVVLDGDGTLRLSNHIIATNGRYYQDCGDGTTSLRWVNADGVGGDIELGRVYRDGGTPYDGQQNESNERVQFGYVDVSPDVSTFYITATTNANGLFTNDADDKRWEFQGTGGLKLPDGSVLYTANVSATTAVVSATAPDASNGTVWFNTTDARTYVKYNGTFVDASPAVIPLASTYTGELEIIDNTITNTNLADEAVNIVPGVKTWRFTDTGVTFPDGTTQATAYTHQPILELDGGNASTWLTA